MKFSRVVLVVLLLPVFASADPAPKALKQGNRQFWKGNYDRALTSYNEALADDPHSSPLHYNAGGALYQLGRFEDAEREFAEAAQATDPGLRAAAHYNRGNAFFKQQAWDKAIESYKDSLRINPADEDAKFNLGLAMQTKNNPPQGGKGQGQPKDSKPKEDKSKEGGQDGMSKEDAQRILSAAASEEQRKPDQKTKGNTPGIDDDW